MNLLVVILRFVHVAAAIFWGGGALLMGVIIGPTIAATGEAGQKFAQHLTTKIRIHVILTIAALSAVLGGAWLYWIDSDGFTSAWVKSSTGIGFGIGALFGLIAFVFGANFGSGLARLGEIGVKIQGKPTPEQLGEIQAIQKRLAVVSPIHLVAMTLAIICMATARYWFIIFK